MAGIPSRGPGPALSDPASAALLLGFQLVTGLLSGLGNSGFKPGYRMVGPGVWAKVPVDAATQLNPEGYRYYSAQRFALRDDAIGTVTGTPNDYIHNAIDVFRYRAQVLAGEPAANFTTGLGVFGSLTQARADLNALTPLDAWPVMYRVIRPETPEQTAERLMSQGPFTIWRSDLTGKWMAQVHKPAASISSASIFYDADLIPYRFSLERDVIGVPQVSKTFPEDCANEVHVLWRMYAPSGAMTRDTYVSPESSDDGDGVQDESGPGNRQERMLESTTVYNVRSPIQISCDHITQKQQAVAIRNWAADRLWRPRLVVALQTWGIAATMEPNMVTYLDDDWHERHQPMIYPGQTGTHRRWSSIPFRVAIKVQQNSSEGDAYGLVLEEIL